MTKPKAHVPDADKAPNQWNALSEYLKTVVALGSALLALTVTFSREILKTGSGDFRNGLLIGSWGMLLLTIFFGILGMALLVNYLRNGTRERRCVLISNLAFFSLVAAGVFLAALGLVGVLDYDELSDLKISIEQAKEAAALSPSVEVASLSVESAKWHDHDKVYEIVLRAKSGPERFRIVVDSDTRRIDLFERKTN